MMNNLLRYRSILVVLIISIASWSCQDFLTNPTWGEYTDESFWTTETNVQYAVDALYSYSNTEEIGGRGHMWFENCSDDMVTGRVHAAADRIRNFQGGADFGAIETLWSGMYQQIAKCNDLILNVPKMGDIVSEDLRDFSLGQAYFFRGYAYLWIAPWFGDNGPNGGIPIIREGMKADEINAEPRPASVLENYDFIIQDLRQAAELLPSWSELAESDYGRPYKTAAWAFAARAALYAAQYDAKYYDIVIEMCDKIINLTGADKRELYPDFTKLFTVENNFSSEFIFSILGNATHGPKFHGMGFQKDGYGYYNTWGYYTPTAELYEAYSSNDIRRDATILTPGQHITFIGHDILYAINANGDADASTISSPTGMTFRKFMSVFEPADCLGKTVNTSGDNQTNELGQCVMRYADVLLMKAEALIKGGKGSNTSVENCSTPQGLLGQIRVRAGLDFANSGSLEELKKQRRLELAYEFLPSRHIDLVRWGDAEAIYTKPQYGFEPKVKKTIVDKIGEDGNPVIGEDGNVVKEVIYTFDSSTKVKVWDARNYNPAVNHVFALPQAAVSKSLNVPQNKGY